MLNDPDLNKQLGERFSSLPKVVQDAITSADVEKHLRTLAEHHKLHLDQWEKLENEVMLALLGFQPAENLQENIHSEVGVDDATAAAIASDISTVVFQPIRQELERQLEHPDAVPQQATHMETMRSQVLSDEQLKQEISSVLPVQPPTVAATPVAPATPPAEPQTQKVERAPISTSYKVAEPSHERKSIEGDPYREQIS